MRKISAAAVLLAAALALSACSGDTKDDLVVETPSGSTADNAATEGGEETGGDNGEETGGDNSEETGEDNNEEPPAENTPGEDVTALIEQFGVDSFTAPDGSEVMLTEAVSQTNDYLLNFDFAYIRYAEPIYSDTVTNPDIYDFDNFEFTVDNEAEVDGAAFRVVKGQTLDNGLTVTGASYELALDPELSRNEVELEGELTLEGLLFCFFEEEYGFEEDEVIFYPNPASAAVPVIYNPDMRTKSGIDLYSEFAFICDGDLFRLGSINDIGKTDWFANGSYVRVKVTLSDLKLSYGMFGSICHAEMKNVEFL